ncbi:MAG: hypothetical protein LDL33_12565 [Desulfomonile sp.]|nr:hypothetical protein [Desulfomonile sp.]
MEVVIGVGVWVLIFVVWYMRTYPDRFPWLNSLKGLKFRFPRVKRPTARPAAPSRPPRRDFKTLVDMVESISSRDRMSASDAASMVEAVRQLLEIEPASGQLWEALALDSLEAAVIICDECKVPVDKFVKKTGVKIQCSKCLKWLALRNSKVTVIDPKRAGLEDWEH